MPARKPRNPPTSKAPPAAAEAIESLDPGRGTAAVFPIVGIGASAGGLEALEQFLRAVPDASGMAFVIVQHMDPTHEGALPGILQRATRMKVAEVRDRTKVQRNCVYVIPPNRDLSILHGVLHLLEPAGRRGLRLPIDSFFRSLADDERERSIGVILSGMGSDGTEGLRAIREQAGLALVQEPTSARFDGMPRSAVAAGVANIVAPAAELPARILACVRHGTPVRPGAALEIDSRTRSSLDKVILLLRERTRNDFSLYKRNTLYRRIERRMGIHQIGGIDLYVRYLRENPAELDLLFKEFLIGVTSFFRDPAVWERLAGDVLPALLSDRCASPVFRAWVPGCSTGEEAYSLAIAFHEALSRAGDSGRRSLQIFATDLDREAVDHARSGVFAAGIEADVSPERLERFFVRQGGRYRVVPAIRESVVFAPQNVTMDPPFTRLDLLSCRNLLIYLAPELQKRLMSLFHYCLRPGGVLVLGTAETATAVPGLFETLEGRLGSPYGHGCLALVRHPLDDQCASVAARLLTPT